MAAQIDRIGGYWNEFETMDPEVRREAKWRRVQALLAHAAAHTREFPGRLAAAGMAVEDIRTWEDFQAIPVLRKKELIGLQRQGDRLGGLLAVELGRLRRVYQSPGPIFDPEGEGPDYWGWAEAFFAAGFRRGDLVQMTFGYHLTPAGLMLEEPLREIGCAVIPAGPGNTEVQIDLLTSLPVTGFVGMASYLKIIGEKARQAGHDLHKDMHLDVAFVAAERLSDGLRTEVEQAFGITVRQGYGTADVGAIAYECPHGQGMHLSSRAVVEVVDPGTHRPVPPGELGEVLVTPFSDAYPLIRLATGDLSRLEEAPCPCGRTSRRLAGILGRVDDTAKVKGQFIYPHQAAAAVAEHPTIAAFQIEVRNPGGRDQLCVRLQCTGPVDLDVFAADFQARCKLRPIVELLAEGEAIDPGAPRLVDRRTF